MEQHGPQHERDHNGKPPHQRADGDGDVGNREPMEVQPVRRRQQTIIREIIQMLLIVILIIAFMFGRLKTLNTK